MSGANKLKAKIDEFEKTKNMGNDLLSNKPSDKDKTFSAVNIVVELISYTISGVIVGKFFDKMFAFDPFFLITCIIISYIAFFWSIWKKYIK